MEVVDAMMEILDRKLVLKVYKLDAKDLYRYRVCVGLEGLSRSYTYVLCAGCLSRKEEEKFLAVKMPILIPVGSC